MTGGRRRWLLAGVAAIVALVCWGGVALAGSLLSGPRAPLFEKNGPIAQASDGVQLAQVVHRKTSRTPADDQYANPLGKLCADPSALTFVAGNSTNDGIVTITNCGDVPVNLFTPQRSNPGSPFEAIDTLFLPTQPKCPIYPAGLLGVLPLQPGESCVVFFRFGVQSPRVPPTPPGDYSDMWTFAGDNGSVTVALSGTMLNGATTFFVSAWNSPDLSALCGQGPMDTGIDLSAGQEAVITASGMATWSTLPPTGPDGDPLYGVGYYVPGGHIAALIGRVGAGDWMTIGRGPTTVSGPGALQLAFDDAINTCDNSGGFVANVQVQAGH